jgi:hypothetical protein
METGSTGDQIIDCRRERTWARLESGQLEDGVRQLGARYARVILDFADGVRFVIEPKQRWRLFRRPAKKLA